MREQLAELEHERWSRWMQHLFSQSTVNADGSVTIPAWAVERWKRQIEASYAELSEAEKDSDRAEADRTLKLLEELRGKC